MRALRACLLLAVSAGGCAWASRGVSGSVCGLPLRVFEAGYFAKSTASALSSGAFGAVVSVARARTRTPAAGAEAAWEDEALAVGGGRVAVKVPAMDARLTGEQREREAANRAADVAKEAALARLVCGDATSCPRASPLARFLGVGAPDPDEGFSIPLVFELATGAGLDEVVYARTPEKASRAAAAWAAFLAEHGAGRGQSTLAGPLRNLDGALAAVEELALAVALLTSAASSTWT